MLVFACDVVVDGALVVVEEDFAGGGAVAVACFLPLLFAGEVLDELAVDGQQGAVGDFAVAGVDEADAAREVDVCDGERAVYDAELGGVEQGVGTGVEGELGERHADEGFGEVAVLGHCNGYDAVAVAIAAILGDDGPGDESDGVVACDVADLDVGLDDVAFGLVGSGYDSEAALANLDGERYCTACCLLLAGHVDAAALVYLDEGVEVALVLLLACESSAECADGCKM